MYLFLDNAFVLGVNIPLSGCTFCLQSFPASGSFLNESSFHTRQRESRVPEDKIDSITVSMDTNLSKLWEMVKDRGGCCAAVHGVAKSWM